jgi:hypothetical protein
MPLNVKAQSYPFKDENVFLETRDVAESCSVDSF